MVMVMIMVHGWCHGWNLDTYPPPPSLNISSCPFFFSFSLFSFPFPLGSQRKVCLFFYPQRHIKPALLANRTQYLTGFLLAIYHILRSIGMHEFRKRRENKIEQIKSKKFTNNHDALCSRHALYRTLGLPLHNAVDIVIP
jgi:hypothetical protein